MRHNPHHEATDEQVVRDLIAANPWATLVSQVDGDLVASHYPVLLDDRDDDLAVVTHIGRPDERLHRFGSTEVMLIIAATHGYISPSWYTEHGTPVPTWNFSVAHCYGVPEVLSAQENLRVLTRLVHHFEQHVGSPVPLDPEIGEKLAQGTVGLRLPITRFVCKVKMSQDKDLQSRRQVIEALRAPGPYRNEVLADDMQRALAE
jgi:transcriptional regulator